VGSVDQNQLQVRGEKKDGHTQKSNPMDHSRTIEIQWVGQVTEGGGWMDESHAGGRGMLLSLKSPSSSSGKGVRPVL
jgi:hypothetical protein